MNIRLNCLNHSSKYQLSILRDRFYCCLSSQSVPMSLNVKFYWCFQTRLISSPIICASRVRISYPLQWGAPTFDAGDVFGVMTAALVALVEVLILMMWFASFFRLSPLLLYCYTKVSFQYDWQWSLQYLLLLCLKYSFCFDCWFVLLEFVN
jgi:hypothetical protein